MKKILIFSILLALSAPAMAYYCSKPYVPSCVTGYLDFTSDYDFQSCKRQLESYLASVKRYNQCLIDEAEEEISKANREAEGAIKKFNCKARGDSLCF